VAKPSLSYPVALLVERPPAGRPPNVVSLRDEPLFSARVLFAALRDPLRTLRHLSPRAVWLAQTLRQRGITEVRAQDPRLQRVAKTVESLIGGAKPDTLRLRDNNQLGLITGGSNGRSGSSVATYERT